ncbi:hypothetical protein [Bacillus sp. T33-2]|uniref:hypothetical protein n=1 Tax=Bacillus sp. T33-2 TaxID=2054168 RepID=UPI0015E14957|nr:hypothetical protein [Bacillus sp. T33-2]
MSKEEIVHEIKMKLILLNHDLYQGKKKTKKEEAVLLGKIDELEKLISLIEYRSQAMTK